MSSTLFRLLPNTFFHAFKTNVFLASVLLIVCSLMNSLSAAPIHLTKLAVPQPAPNFRLIDLDNKIHTLVDFKGKPLIVNFWATWCPPCRAELPSFNRAWAKVKDQDVQMLAINVGESPTTVFNFIKQFPIDFKVLLDPQSDELANWQMQGLPTTFILDSYGRVVYQAIGERAWDSDELLTKVLELRKPNTLSKDQTQ